MSAQDKSFRCPACGEKIPFSYSFKISDYKRVICKGCGKPLVPKTDNVIFRRVAIIIAALAFVVLYSKLVFGYLEVERTLVASLLHLVASAMFYLLLCYLFVVRVVKMKEL
jgi:predicted RNA-binding Zn-ribbon protein involved in translation (DUF1610 family)